jgi:NAD(P)-dependent dehydrogenase (short-subunit alcohol dehydrogenase family)
MPSCGCAATGWRVRHQPRPVPTVPCRAGYRGPWTPRGCVVTVTCEPGHAAERGLRGNFGLARTGGINPDGSPRDFLALALLSEKGAFRIERPPAFVWRIDFDDQQGERSYSGARAYNQSKLANVLFTYELARRLQATSVTANALHPGVVDTSFGAEDPGGVQRLFVPFMRPFMKAPAQGAATSIHLASAPDLEQLTGRYFANSAPKGSSKRSYDEAAAARLWQVSADLVGLTAPATTS